MRAALALAALLLTACGVQPAEDQKGWDCRTMGNGDCGPIREEAK